MTLLSCLQVLHIPSEVYCNVEKLHCETYMIFVLALTDFPHALQDRKQTITTIAIQISAESSTEKMKAADRIYSMGLLYTLQDRR